MITAITAPRVLAGPEGLGKKTSKFRLNSIKGGFCSYRGTINPNSEREVFHPSIPIF